MVITSELLAAYAAGNVSQAERLAVRQYLKDHPERLQTVLIAMDDDCEIRLDRARAKEPDAAGSDRGGLFAALSACPGGLSYMSASRVPAAGTDDTDDGCKDCFDGMSGSDDAEIAGDRPFAAECVRADRAIRRPFAVWAASLWADNDDDDDYDEGFDRRGDAGTAESVEEETSAGESAIFCGAPAAPAVSRASSVGTGAADDTDPARQLERRLDELLDSMDWTQTRRRTYPLTAMAAEDRQNKLCAIRCEGIALRHFGFDVGDGELIGESRAAGWLRAEGTALHHIGKLSGRRGLNVAHRYDCSPGDILRALEKNQVVIAAVDGGELVGDPEWELKEDALIGEIPDHAVVVTAIDNDTVTIIDPSTSQDTDTYPITQFLDAWADSSRNLILIGSGDDYEPHPIDLSDIEISDDLRDLCEVLAENAHEVWASDRMREGWTYGPVRDDRKRRHPDLLPYNRLEESKKLQRCEMAANTLRLLKKLGWDPVKR